MNGINNTMNLNESEKSKGIVVFAFNSATVDYVALADQTSRLTAKALDLPITLITDMDASPVFSYDRVIRIESQSGNFRVDNGVEKEWRNFGRYLAYELSPYDETLLIDGDYLVLDNSLLKLFDQPFDYRLMHNSQTPGGPSYKLMGSIAALPFVWATVVLFRKSPKTEQYFDLIGRIQRNYGYYRALFNGHGSYRNDYAFAMADIILNGYSIDEYKSIPWNMITIEDKISKLESNGKFIVVRQDNKADVIAKQNLHVMDKDYLLSDDFKRFVAGECDAT